MKPDAIEGKGRIPAPPPKGMTETASREARKALNSSLKKYRPEIDGLRAFAVVAVIINHFNKDLLPSGYLGVDIFFVISGYVITSSLAGRESKNFLEFLTGFYERRIKRLVPALVVFVLITGVLISFFNPDPGGALGLGWKSLLGVSNISLYRSSTDYFAQSTELNPYTHTWSLGVEEQFYLRFRAAGYKRRAKSVFVGWSTNDYFTRRIHLLLSAESTRSIFFDAFSILGDVSRMLAFHRISETGKD